MAFSFNPRLETPSSQYNGRDANTPRQSPEISTGNRNAFGQGSADNCIDTPFAMYGSAFDLDPWKRGERQACHTKEYNLPNFDSSFANQLNRYVSLDDDGSRRESGNITAWHMDQEQVRRQGCEAENWPKGATPSAVQPAPMSAFQAYSMAPMHQRFASASSGCYGDDRPVPPSEPGSDFSSEYSDLFQSSGLPLPPVYPRELQDETPPSSGLTDSYQQKPLPDYVVDELKRLKLENMALRRMAQEVVRINIGPGSLDSQAPDRPPPSCAHHLPLTCPPRFRRVCEGADPVQVYREPATTATAPASFGRVQESGAAASMWAPKKQASEPLSPVTAGNTSATEFKASMISAAELSRRVATPACQQPSTTDSPFGNSPCAAPLPAHLRAKPLSRTSPRDSPGPTPFVPSRLESTPAAALVGMILDKRGQDASLLLQQQLKNGSPERQDEILQAICARIVPLSHDRHGNFLVQGAIEQRPETATHLKGAFVELTMSQFGCHVVQKALEGEEATREAVTEELLGSRLDQTLTSRHSIHVWQRILETEWTRPQFREQIFASINRQLKGRWARTARQETGSIICQNIFESAQPAEKAMCMKEVLEELDECATNQWGVWVVQHIIEHGAEEERKSALRGLVRSATKLTLSQYGKSVHICIGLFLSASLTDIKFSFILFVYRYAQAKRR